MPNDLYEIVVLVLFVFFTILTLTAMATRPAVRQPVKSRMDDLDRHAARCPDMKFFNHS
jgi:hypothetical protein